MSTLHVELKVKFRAFFTDLLKVEKVWDEPLGVALPNTTLISFNERGVQLKVQIR